MDSVFYTDQFSFEYKTKSPVEIFLKSSFYLFIHESNYYWVSNHSHLPFTSSCSAMLENLE